MSSERPAQEQDGGKGDSCGCHDPGSGGSDDGGHGEDCRPDLIDDLKCQAKGVQAQYEYNQQTQQAVETARTTYDDTRKKYRSTRDEVEPLVQDLRHDAKSLVDRIRCQILQERIVGCLDEAFAEYVVELEKCPDEAGGCCADGLECTFEYDRSGLSDETPQEQVDRLTEIIAGYQKHVTAASGCFDELVGEPDALRKRVDDAKAAIADVKAILAANAATTDLKRLYARALVVQRALGKDIVWAGFDSSHAFVDCLCRALTCWTKGWEAIGKLTRRKAVAQCRADSAAAHCTYLRENAADEILAIYDRICGHSRCTRCGHEHPPATTCSEREEVGASAD